MAQGTSWSEEMMSDSDEDDNESPHKRQKTQHTFNKPRGGSVRFGSGVTASSQSSTTSSSRERSEEKSIYSQFSKPDKERAKILLFDSIKGSCVEALKKLLRAGMDINVKNEDKATPLWMAIEENCPPEMISLVMTSSLIGTRYKQNLAPIHRAAMKDDHLLMLQMINTIRAKPLPDIVQGSEEQQIEQVKSQRQESGEGKGSYEIVNKKNKYGWTPLHYAADGGYVQVLQVLLMEKECDVTLATKLGQTAFDFAARKGHLPCLKLLFAAAQCSQSLNSIPKDDKKGWNIACHASAQDNCEVMEWLLNNMSQYGADITHNTEKGSNAILIACEYQKIEMFKFLFDKSPAEFPLTKDDKSMLHIAACHDSVDIVELVLAKGYPVDQQDQNGETPLHVAYKWGSNRVRQLLYQNGADDTIENNDKKKPPDLAYQKFKIPKEIAKRGKKAIAKYVADLRKGKAKMPRCKLMILGEAGVGKTSLLSLLTGEPFNPDHNKTEGIDTDFVRTSNICSKTWEKKAMEGDEEYKDVASKQFALQLHKEEPVKQHQKKKAHLINPTTLKQQVESLVNKYTKQSTPPTSPKPKFNKVRTGSNHHLPVQNNPIPRPLAMPLSTLLQPTLPVVPILHLPPPSKVVHTALPSKPSSVTASFVPSSVLRSEPSRTTTPQQPPHTVSTDPDHIDTEIMRRAVKLKKLKSSDAKIELPLKFSSFDFAGQKHYKPMHHCFLTSRAVYVVAFNVRHLLSDQQNQCVQELKFWINSIHIYTDDDAKIVLVGTHRGPYRGHNGKKRLDPLTAEQKKTIDSIMTKNFDKDCYDLRVSWPGRDKIIAMVENSLTGDRSGANVIRQKLLELGDRYPGNNDDLPTSYLRLEAKIFKERKKNNLISRKEVEGWAKEFGIDDPTVALTFFHDIGTIIDPSKLPAIFVTKDRLLVLQDTILLFPQWLADVMKELMEIERNDPKYNPKSIRQLQQDGIVDKQFLSILWEKQLKESRETFQIISVLLQAYGLIIPVVQQEALQYYIPFQLPSDSDKMKKSTSDCNRIHISFSLDDGFLPPFLLHHVMFKLYTHSQRSKECCFLATKGFIESLNGCQWWVRQKNDDVIEVLIRTNPNIRTILPAMQYLNQSLVTILKELKAVKYTLGPVAVCVGCKEEKLLKYITYTDHKSDIADKLKCSSCASYEPISITTKAVISKAYKISVKSFFDQIKRLDEYVLKQLERKLKRKNKMDNETTLYDIIEELYEKDEHDPWPQVVSVLERLSYDGCDGASDLVKQIKREQLCMCDHTE